MSALYKGLRFAIKTRAMPNRIVASSGRYSDNNSCGGRMSGNRPFKCFSWNRSDIVFRGFLTNLGLEETNRCGGIVQFVITKLVQREIPILQHRKREFILFKIDMLRALPTCSARFTKRGRVMAVGVVYVVY